MLSFVKRESVRSYLWGPAASGLVSCDEESAGDTLSILLSLCCEGFHNVRPPKISLSPQRLSAALFLLNVWTSDLSKEVFWQRGRCFISIIVLADNSLKMFLKSLSYVIKKSDGDKNFPLNHFSWSRGHIFFLTFLLLKTKLLNCPLLKTCFCFIHFLLLDNPLRSAWSRNWLSDYCLIHNVSWISN